MDAFFASVEQRDQPHLQGKPIAVGSTDRRGVVATCSYEARKFGVRSAMPSYKARELCPDIIFVKPHFQKYREASLKIQEIFKSYTDILEFASIDEAYLDITPSTNGNIDKAIEIARSIKKDIINNVGVTATIGLSINKFLAKTASELEKPDGLTVIRKDEVYDLITDLPIEKFRGIGKVTAPKMMELGIETGRDLRNLSLDELTEIFGDRRSGWFYNIARGIDDRPVSSTSAPRKSIGVSQTFQRDVASDHIAGEELSKLADEISHRMQIRNLKGQTITVKIKYMDFTISTRSKTIGIHIDTKNEILDVCLKLLKANPLRKPIRLLGITISNFNTDSFPSLW